MENKDNISRKETKHEGEVQHQVIPGHVVREDPPLEMEHDDDEKIKGVHVTDVEGTGADDEDADEDQRGGVEFDRETGPSPGDADASRMTI